MSERVPSGLPQPQGAGEDPLTHYTRLFCKFLQCVFGSFDKGSYHWETDAKSTDIVISDQATIKREEVEKRPAILIARGPLALTNISLDQFAGPLLEKNQTTGQETFTPNLDMSAGSRRHTDLSSCTMTYNCLSKEGLEAQRIAWLAGYFTRTLKRSLMKAGIHRVGEEVMFGAESAPGAVVQPDPNEIVMVTVSVPFYYQDTWTVSPTDKLLLKRVDVALRSEVGYPAPGAVPIKEPGIYGRVLAYDKVISLTTRISVGKTSTPKPRS